MTVGHAKHPGFAAMVSLAIIFSLAVSSHASAQQTTSSLATLQSPETGSRDFSARDKVWPAIQHAMQSALDRLSNFSCIQNIRREFAGEQATQGAITRSDFVRLQVTNIDGQEYYSYPGDTRSVTEPHLLVKTGLSGTGLFMGYARAVFLRRPFAMLRLTGHDTWQGRPALRFAFRFDPMRERLNVSRAGGSASISAEGEFLVDEQDHMLRWMRIVGDQPIPELGIREVRYTMVWTVVRNGQATLLMPEQVEVRMEMFNNEVQRNQIQLSQCREFQVESALRFDDVPPDGSAPDGLSAEGATAYDGSAAPPPDVAAQLAALRFAVLPEGLPLELRLDEAVDLMTAAVGDSFTATLQRDVEALATDQRYRRGRAPAENAEVLLSQGAKAEFRIRRLEQVPKPEPHAVVWLELSTIRDGEKVFLGLAELESRDRPRGLVDRLETRVEGRMSILTDLGGYRNDTVEEIIYPSIPGVGAFLFRGEPGVLPVGYRMTWRTIPGRTLED